MAEFAESKEEPTLSGFLEEVALMTSADEQGAESAEYLTLMTLHMAKGLEFPLVFITGLEEHLFPTSRAIEESRSSPASMEEERRLFYVGITRARRHLVLAWSRWRYIARSALSAPTRFRPRQPTTTVSYASARLRQCPVLATSRHPRVEPQCPLYPQKRTLAEPSPMSDL